MVDGGWWIVARSSSSLGASLWIGLVYALHTIHYPPTTTHVLHEDQHVLLDLADLDRRISDVRDAEPIEAARRRAGVSRAILRLERAVVARTDVHGVLHRMADLVLDVLRQAIRIGDEVDVASFMRAADTDGSEAIRLVAAGCRPHDHAADTHRLIRCRRRWQRHTVGHEWRRSKGRCDIVE